MVTRRVIRDIKPIENADRIELAVVDGWQTVVKKGVFSKGDEVYYFEIDSFLPTNLEQFEFLKGNTKKAMHPDTKETVEGHVLRTVKMRGEWSQGLVLPISNFEDLTEQEDIDKYFSTLGVFKYEKPLTQDLEGVALGQYPVHLTRKTDSERVQNVTDEFLQSLEPSEWVATEKIDGTSSTYIKQDGKLRVMGRNIEFDLTKLGVNNKYKQIVDKYKLEDVVKEGQIIKGEIYGVGIQKNRLQLEDVRLAIFSVETLKGYDEQELDDSLVELLVPKYNLELPSTVEDAVKQVNKLKSKINPKVYAEGVVWWNTYGKEFKQLGNRPNFKAINNQYLLKSE